MAFSTKISFVPRDNGERTVSFDMVNYGFDRSSNIFGLIKNDYDFLHFRKIHSNGYYDFMTTLSFDEFIDFHKKYHDKDFDPNSKALEEFINGDALKTRFNWVILVVYEWESGL